MTCALESLCGVLKHRMFGLNWLRHCCSERLTVTEPKGADAKITNQLHQLELISHLESWFTKLTLTLLLYLITTSLIARITATPHLTIFSYLLLKTPHYPILPYYSTVLLLANIFVSP